MRVPQGIHPVRQPCRLARRAPSGGEGFDGLRGTGAASPGGRRRPAAAASLAASAWRPGRLGCGSHAKPRALDSIPPCPRVAASMAASRRRSCSDTQRKKRGIFPSIAAVYPSSSYSLSQKPLYRKDTTASAIREVILDHILMAKPYSNGWLRI